MMIAWPKLAVIVVVVVVVVIVVVAGTIRYAYAQASTWGTYLLLTHDLTSLERTPPLMVYLPYWWRSRATTTVLLKTAGDPAAAAEAAGRRFAVGPAAFGWLVYRAFLP